MASCVVLWISRERATIVSITDGVEDVVHVESKAEPQVEEKRSHKRSGHYRRVIHGILDAQSVFIFGPPQAKIELKREILRTVGLSQRVVGTEIADTMTEDQLVEEARDICGSRRK